MMRCTECEGTFRWGRFGNTTKHVIIEHCPDAPPPRAQRGAAAEGRRRVDDMVDDLLRRWMQHAPMAR